MPRGFVVFQNERVDFGELGQLGLFKHVNFSEIQGQLQSLPVLLLPERATLISPGQPNQVVYLVLSGRLRVFADEAQQQPIGLIQGGECIGLLSLIDRQPCHVTVIAEQPCRLVAIDEERLFALINSSAAMSRNVLFLIMHYLRGKDSGAPERVFSARFARNSSIDPVTGLYNRRWLEDVLERQIMRAATDRRSLALIAVDIDGLGQFNDEFGRNAGDQALYTIGSLIGGSIRPTDMLARYDSDSFIVVLPESDRAGAELVAARLQRMVRETGIEIPGECRLPPISVSVGITEMKSFVAGRKLIDDAVAALDADRHAQDSKKAAG